MERDCSLEATAGTFDVVHSPSVDAVDGGELAFDDLYRQHSTFIYNACLGILGNADEAEDALQDTFVQLYKSLADIKDQKVLRTWLYRVAVNKCISILRRRPRWKSSDTVDQFAVCVEPAGDHIFEQQVRQAILRLKPHYRAVLVLHYFQSLSYAEIADTLCCSMDQARIWLHRARKAFKNVYDQGDEEDEV